jgi:hypothetical protein
MEHINKLLREELKRTEQAMKPLEAVHEVETSRRGDARAKYPSVAQYYDGPEYAELRSLLARRARIKTMLGHAAWILTKGPSVP